MSGAFVSYPFTVTRATHSRTDPTRINDVVNVKDYGAKGNGSNNDAAAIQAAIDAAFGTSALPNSVTKRDLNAVLFFPAGTYNIDVPLVLTQVEGGRIIGAGKMASKIVNTTVAGASGYGTVFRTDGWLRCIVKNIHLVASAHTVGSLNCCFDAAWSNTAPNTAVGNGGNTFINVRFESGDVGCRIGGDAGSGNPNVQGSEYLFLGCDFASSLTGIQGENSNALDFTVIGGSTQGVSNAFDCNNVSTFPYICGVSLRSFTDVVFTSFGAIQIDACRSISDRFLSIFTGSGTGTVKTTACSYIKANGDYADMQRKLIMDGCVVSGAGVLCQGNVGSGSGGTIYMRGGIPGDGLPANFITGSTNAPTVGESE